MVHWGRLIMGNERVKKRSEVIKKECIELFSSNKIFYNCGLDLISRYKILYSYPEVKNFFKDEELISTSKVFFDNNLNISLASKVGFMHRNTLVYRLDKIKKIIGLDIRNFNEAVVFQNFLLFYDMIKHELY